MYGGHGGCVDGRVLWVDLMTMNFKGDIQKNLGNIYRNE